VEVRTAERRRLEPPPIYFAQVREDSRVECGLVREYGLRKVACVASGGCTAFSLLAAGARRVDAVDVNRSQAALVELKKAALRALSQRAYLDFIERHSTNDRWATYSELRATLPEDVRGYWDDRRAGVEGGINHCGVTEAFYRFVGNNVVQSVIPAPRWRHWLQCSSPDERRALHRELGQADGFRAALRVLLSRTTHLLFYPDSVFDQVSEHDFGEFFLQRLLDEISSRSLRDNYFLSQLLFGEYRFDEPEGVPPYLNQDHYERVRCNLDSLHLHVGSLERFLSGQSGYDAIFLSNVFDWSPPDARERIAEATLRAAAPGAIVLYRQMLAQFPLPRAFVEGLEIDRESSERLTALDRSLLYRSVIVGRVRNAGQDR
jgi:S-adenosylmethionine-diacylglycerol 3-amino-3-carboxypropyl transferase